VEASKVTVATPPAPLDTIDPLVTTVSTDHFGQMSTLPVCPELGETT